MKISTMSKFNLKNVKKIFARVKKVEAFYSSVKAAICSNCGGS